MKQPLVWKLPNNQNFYICLLAAGAIFLSSVCVFAVCPKVKLIINLKKEINISQRRLMIKERNLAGYQENINEYNALHMRLERLNSVVVPHEDAALAVTCARDTLISGGITETHFYAEEGGKLHDAADGRGVYRINMYMSGYGTYEDIISLLYELENGEVRYSMDNITLKGNISDSGDIFATLKLSAVAIKSVTPDGAIVFPEAGRTVRNPFEAVR